VIALTEPIAVKDMTGIDAGTCSYTRAKLQRALIQKEPKSQELEEGEENFVPGLTVHLQDVLCTGGQIGDVEFEPWFLGRPVPCAGSYPLGSIHQLAHIRI
jgi:hypothetical protein